MTNGILNRAHRLLASAALVCSLAPASCSSTSQTATVVPDSDGVAWVGRYKCAQGPTAMRLEFQDDGSGKLTGLFQFHHPRGHGSYHVVGALQGRTGDVKFKPSGWVDNPGGGWEMVGFGGKFKRDGQEFMGYVADRECLVFMAERFSLERADEAYLEEQRGVDELASGGS